MTKKRKPKPTLVTPCPKCGQRADEPPGFRLTDDGPEAVFVHDQLVATDPEVLECRTCGHKRLVPRDSVEKVRQADGTPYPLPDGVAST
jgi:hypothetical protein